MTRFIKDCGAFVSLVTFATGLYLWISWAQASFETLA